MVRREEADQRGTNTIEGNVHKQFVIGSTFMLEIFWKVGGQEREVM